MLIRKGNGVEEYSRTKHGGKKKPREVRGEEGGRDSVLGGGVEGEERGGGG